jgi:acyl carrier protein
MENQTNFEQNIARLIKKTIHLEIESDTIDPEAPLYSEGLGLDSIDILEISVALTKEYKVTINSEEEITSDIFMSLRTLSRYVQNSMSSESDVLLKDEIVS